MTSVNLRYKLNKEEQEALDSILQENPFFESKEIFRFLLGFYTTQKKSKKSPFRKQRLQSVSKSFGITDQPQEDDDLIDSSKPLKKFDF